MKTRRIHPLVMPATLVSFLALSPLSQAEASGNHFGWCQGVGNKHNSGDCNAQSGGGPDSVIDTPITERPAANPLPPGGSGLEPTKPLAPTPSTTPVIAKPEIVPQAVPQPVPQQAPPKTPKPLVQSTPGLVPQPPVPQPVPQQVPPKTPEPLAQSTPGLVPQPPVPQPVPQQVPPKTPKPLAQSTPKLVPALVPPQAPSAILPTKHKQPSPNQGVTPSTGSTLVSRPQPNHQTATVTGSGGQPFAHSNGHRRPPLSPNFIAPKAGLQRPHAVPSFMHESGERWDCVMSGFHDRAHEEQAVSSGVLLHVDTNDQLFADVPAEHPLHPGCMISVKRKF